jgi:Na+/melibiose symporter-like transporter
MAGFFVVPLLPWRSSHAIDAGVLTLNAEIVAVGVPALTLMACLWVPAGTMRPRAAPHESFLATARSVARNRPLVLYLINALISGLGNGMNVSLAYVYISDQLRLADSFSLILMANVLANLVALPPWRWVIHRFGKRYAWALGLLLNAATMPAFLFIPAGPRGFWPVLLLAALSGATYSVCNVTLPAILADVVDYETWRSRQVRTGSVFAAYALVRKFNSAVGSGAAFLLLAAFGYKPGTAAPGSTWGLMITFALIPTALQLVSAAMAANFPIDDRRHGVLRRWLARRTRQGHIASEVTCG